MAAIRIGHLPLVSGLLALAAGLGCADGDGPGGAPADGPESRPSLPALILSNPAAPGVGTRGTARAALVDGLVYVSLPPGSLTDAGQVLLTNLTTGAGATGAVRGGGFDPVPLPASAGDSVRVQVPPAGNTAERVFFAKAPPRRAPMVVRSDPQARRSDVPLNSRILVVFSEPLSDAAVAESAMRLTLGGARVPVAMAFADSAHVSMVLTPVAPLAPGSTYTVQFSSALTDRDGDAIAAPESIQFSTQSPPVVAPSGGIPACCTVDASFERTVPHAGESYRQSEFILRRDGTFTMHYWDPAKQPSDLRYHGSYTLADSMVMLEFGNNAGHPMGPWAAQGTLRGDVLAVRFNTHASLSDFEDGDYRRRLLGGATDGGTGRGTLRLSVTTSGPDAPRSVHGLLSGDAIRSIVDGAPADDHPTLPIGPSELALAPGRYALSLEPPANCATNAPVEFVIVPDSTTSLERAVSCTAWAWLSVAHVIRSEAGPTLTAIIYVCSGGRCADYWPSSDAMWIPVAAGAHQLRFMGYPNCRERPTDGVSVSVGPGEVRSVTLSVWCE
jgi:hypothetical protein